MDSGWQAAIVSNSTVRKVRGSIVLSRGWGGGDDMCTRLLAHQCMMFLWGRVCLALWCNVAHFCQDLGECTFACCCCLFLLHSEVLKHYKFHSVTTETCRGFILCLAACEWQVHGSSPRWWRLKRHKCMCIQSYSIPSFEDANSCTPKKTS